MDHEDRYRIRTVSRLDCPTSGCLAVPLSRAAEEFLTDRFKRREVRKTYLALVAGEAPARGTIRQRLRLASTATCYKSFVHPDGKLATTHYKRTARLIHPLSRRAYSLLEVATKGHKSAYSQTLVTGRTHQIQRIS